MTPEEKRLVQESFAEVQRISAEAARLFYQRLFELNPQLRALFKNDMEEQGRKLMHMIGLAVRGLDRPEELLPAVRALGARHAAYGVRDEDYETVGAALIWTLAAGLGPSFTPATKAAWLKVYDLLAATMKEAALKVAAPAYA
jgi:hemoglobin-like flavoprotein